MSTATSISARQVYGVQRVCAAWGFPRATYYATAPRVLPPGDLPGVVTPLLNDPAAARAMGERARRAAADVGAGLDRLWEALQPLLPPSSRPRR